MLTGGKTADDYKFIHKQIRKLKKNKVLQYVDFIHDFRTSELNVFFKKLSVLCVPVVKGEAFGLYLLEALASGIPVVQPNLAAFPEIIATSKAGIVFHPNTSDALAEKLAEVLSDTARLNEMSLNGRIAVEEKFNLKKSTEKLIEIYQKHIIIKKTINHSSPRTCI